MVEKEKDIVERLRRYADGEIIQDNQSKDCLAAEAANEIERLRLRKDRFYDQTGDGEHNDWKDMCDALDECRECKDIMDGTIVMQGKTIKALRSRIKDAETEIERLRARLAKLETRQLGQERGKLAEINKEVSELKWEYD